VKRNGGPAFEERFLETLSNAPGVSGGEGKVREALIAMVKDKVDSLEIDAMGSLVARIEPAGGRGAGATGSARAGGSRRTRSRSRGPHVMLCAHMDEIGLLVTAVDKEGRLRVRKVGGIDNRILVGQVFRIGESGVRGVVGCLPPHLVSRAEREKVTPVEDLYLDIGGSSRDEVGDRVAIGDYAVFDTTYERWGTVAKGKAFDDRAGCAVLASLVQQRPPVPVTAVWTVQEEVGLRGAAGAARRVSPDLAIVLEGTASGEMPHADRAESSPRMGEGPALTIQDRSLMADRRLLETIQSAAARARIPTQWKRPGVGGTDAGRIAIAGAGAPAAVISAPCRYIHAPAAYLDLRDARRMVDLVWSTLETLRKEWP